MRTLENNGGVFAIPLTIKPPKYKEGVIVTAIDKLNSVREMPSITVMSVDFGKKIYKKVFKKI